MYENNGLVLSTVGMGIVLRRFSMGSPACMSDTARPWNRSSSVCFLCQNLKASLCLHNLDLTTLFIANSDSR